MKIEFKAQGVGKVTPPKAKQDEQQDEPQKKED